MPLIAITRLHLRSIRNLPGFLRATAPTITQAESSTGFLGGMLLVEPFKTFWTCTVWTDEGSMKDYRDSMPHRAVMPMLKWMCDTASVVHWKIEDFTEMPTWNEAYRRMLAEGRISPTDSGSFNDLALIPEPSSFSRHFTRALIPQSN